MSGTIFVGNLPFEISDDELIEWAETCVGPVRRRGWVGGGGGLATLSIGHTLSLSYLCLGYDLIGSQENGGTLQIVASCSSSSSETRMSGGC